MPTPELVAEITRLGDEVRALKASKADKAVVKAAVDALLAAKAAYKQATGVDFVPGAAVPAAGTAQPVQPTDAPKSVDVEEAIVDPWTVQGSVDYAKLIEKFGSSAIDQALIDRIEKLTGASCSSACRFCLLLCSVAPGHAVARLSLPTRREEAASMDTTRRFLFPSRP
jgi:hypothetical protein